jgi:hypothetical protein
MVPASMRSMAAYGPHSGVDACGRGVRASPRRPRIRATRSGIRAGSQRGCDRAGAHAGHLRAAREAGAPPRRAARAGGLTAEGHAPGFSSTVMAASLPPTWMPQAERSPRSRFNLVLEPGDSINVPEFDPTVLVRGAVGFETRVLHVPGQPVEYYIEQAGGYDPDAPTPHLRYLPGRGADAGRPAVHGHAASGSGAGEHGVRAAGAGGGRSELGPGAVSRSLSVMGAVATLLIALDRIR